MGGSSQAKKKCDQQKVPKASCEAMVLSLKQIAELSHSRHYSCGHCLVKEVSRFKGVVKCSAENKMTVC